MRRSSTRGRRRGARAARPAIATDAEPRVRIVRQRRHKRSQQQQPQSAAYIPSAELMGFSLPSDTNAATCRRKKPPSSTSSTSSSSSGEEQEAANTRVGCSAYADELASSAGGEKQSEDAAAGTCGLTTFPSQPFARFEFAIEKPSETLVKLAVRNLKTMEKWESNAIELSDFVTMENRVPGATLADYIELFKDSLGDQSLDRAPHDLLSVSASSTSSMWLVISLRVRVLSMQWLASYKFQLIKIQDDKSAKLDIAAIQTKLESQENEIEQLKQQVAELTVAHSSIRNSLTSASKQSKSRTYRACSSSIATRDEAIDWRTQRLSDAFDSRKGDSSTSVQFAKSGLFAVLVVVHHSNCEEDAEAFQLLLNGECVQSCFASNAAGARQTSSLVHFVRAEAADKLSVVYKGSGSSEPASFLEVNQME